MRDGERECECERGKRERDRHTQRESELWVTEEKVECSFGSFVQSPVSSSEGAADHNKNYQGSESTELLTFTSQASVVCMIKCVHDRPTNYHLTFLQK